MASLRVSVSYEMMSKVFRIAKRVNQMGELELGEFREGKPYGRLTIYCDKGLCYNQIIEDPDEDWMKQRKKPVKVNADEMWKAYYRKDNIC